MDDWKTHDDEGRPDGVADETVVTAILGDGTLLAPMRADHLDWNCPGDPIVRYRIEESDS